MLENSEAKGPDDDQFDEIEEDRVFQNSVEEITFENKQNKVDEAEVEHDGIDWDSMELDCEPYVNEGGPSNDDTDAKMQKSNKCHGQEEGCGPMAWC